MLPLLFFKPSNIVEFGLGGGNFTRFLRHLSADITIRTVEYNQQVIDCFNQYFNPDHTQYKLICADSTSWLQEPYSNEFDWFICDVYQAKHLGFDHMIKQLELLASNVSAQSCLSINLPDICDNDINLCLTILQQLMPSHHINYFEIPNYLNIVIHLTPSHWHLHKLIQRNKLTYLPPIILQRWRKFWRHSQQLN
jgi:spermidine synthase